MYFLKNFNNHSEYEAFVSGGTMELPNISRCITQTELHYNPRMETRLIVTYNVINSSNPTQLYFYYIEEGDEEWEITAEKMFDKVEIDGTEVSISTLDSGQGAYQLSNGIHRVAYTLKVPTLIGYDDSTMTFGAMFIDCTSITNITIPNTVTSIGEDSFNSCSSLTSVNIPSGVTNIGSQAFSGCSSLTNITIPSDVVSIGYNAFNGCSSLTNITIPSDVVSIQYNAFSGCSVVSPNFVNNSSLDAEENEYWGCLVYDYEVDGFFLRDNILIKYSGDSTSVTVPYGVTEIKDWVFSGCRNIVNVSVPDSVTTIGYGVFNYCTSLTGVTIGTGITRINSAAHSGTFEGCTNLTNLTVRATTPPILGSDPFWTSNYTIYVPSASVDAYKAASGWSTYASRIQAISNS